VDSLPNRKSPQTREALLTELRGVAQHTVIDLDRAAVDVEARTAEIAWASELPYERWWGIEILDMGSKSVRMGRLRNKAALLLGHDPEKQIGVIESARLDKDRKGRAVVRFSKGALGEEILQDVSDGIRGKVSVGYRIHDLVLESKSEDISTYRVTDWEPFELSIVSVPADDAVGVGRSDERSARKGKIMSQAEEGRTAQGLDPTAAVAAQFNEGEASVRIQTGIDIAERNKSLLALGDQWKDFGGQELARAAIGDPKMTVDAFRKILLDKISDQSSRIAPTDTGRLELDRPEGPQRGVGYGMMAREMLSATSLKAFKGIGEVLNMKDHEVAYRAGMWAQAVIHQNPRAMRWCKDHSVQLLQGSREAFGFDERNMVEGVFTSAGWLVPVEMEAAIIANREEYGVARRVCNVIPMTSASTNIPRITTDATAYFVGEGASVTTSDPAGDQVTLTLKDLMAHTNIGKSTAQDTVVSLAEMVAREQARSFAVKEDSCLISGDGTSTYGGMQGIKTLLDTAAYSAGKYAAASGHDTFAEINVADITGLIGLLPVYARAGSRYIVSGVFDAMVFGALKLNAGGNTVQTVQGRIVEGDYGGFPITVAHHMPAGGGTTYNAVTIALLGNFNLGVAFGSGSGMMLTVDPYTLAHQNLTRVITSERIDINAHGVAKSTTAGQQGPIVGLHGTT
jgi:HK97 family phage major capsid protein